ncbi:1586_t:CDS:2, partial [Cetraspora pellucida]
ELDLVGFKLPCFVLEDGTSVLSNKGMQEALKIVDGGSKSLGGQMTKFLVSKSLQPFILRGKKSADFQPIICRGKMGSINGYEATVLVDIYCFDEKTCKELEVPYRGLIRKFSVNSPVAEQLRIKMKDPTNYDANFKIALENLSPIVKKKKTGKKSRKKINRRYYSKKQIEKVRSDFSQNIDEKKAIEMYLILKEVEEHLTPSKYHNLKRPQGKTGIIGKDGYCYLGVDKDCLHEKNAPQHIIDEVEKKFQCFINTLRKSYEVIYVAKTGRCKCNRKINEEKTKRNNKKSSIFNQQEIKNERIDEKVLVVNKYQHKTNEELE